jgi:lysophospholipase L1-like esterase
MAISRTKHLIRYLFLVAAGVIGFVFLVEAVAWLVAPGRYRNPPAVTAEAWISSDALAGSDTVWLKEFVDEFCRSYSARWVSYVYYRRTPFTGRHINVDSVGRRFTPQFRMDTGTPARSIFLLGGSTMWGTGARDSATIPSALARLLASDPALPPARVVNMGESGYVSTQAILALQLELRKGNIPDLVIMYDGVNDVFSAYQSGEAGVPQNEANRSVEFNLLKEGGRMRALGVGDLWKRTLTAELLDTVRSILRPPPPLPATPPRLAAEVVRTYRGNLEIVEALSRQYGFRYLAYWQPVVFSKADPSPYERRQSDLWYYVRPLFLESYRLVASDPGLRANPSFRDISGVLDGTVAYIDFCHITERGNGLVARRIYEDLKRGVNPIVLR